MNKVGEIVTSFVMAALFAFFIGCEHDDGGGNDSKAGTDVGDNDPNLVICVGDSITLGYNCDGTPYPAVLSSLTQKKCVNAGARGDPSSMGPSRVRSQLSKKPGYMCILYGANDAICGFDPAKAGDHVRTMISMCKGNHTVPIIGTTPPMIYKHEIYNGDVQHVNAAIKRVASEEGVVCVDIFEAFGSGEKYLGADGLHPNAAGAELIANSFAVAF